MIVGSMFVIFNEFPSKAYQNFMIGIFGKGWSGFVGSTIFPATTNMVALLASFTFAYCLVKQIERTAILAGATLSLARLMSFVAKSKQVKQKERLSLVSGLFNINEPLIFWVTDYFECIYNYSIYYCTSCLYFDCLF